MTTGPDRDAGAPVGPVDDVLEWARNQVLGLVDALVTVRGDSERALVHDNLLQLTTQTADPARRLALLLQLSVAFSGVVDIADFRHGVDRLTLRDDLAPLLQATNDARNCES